MQKRATGWHRVNVQESGGGFLSKYLRNPFFRATFNRFTIITLGNGVGKHEEPQSNKNLG